MAVNNGYTSGFPSKCVILFPEKMLSQLKSFRRLQHFTIRCCHNPSVTASANTPSNRHSAKGYYCLSTTPNRLKTHGYSVNSVLRGCVFHYPLLNVITLWVTTVNKEKRGWPSAMRPCIILSFPLKTSRALVTTLFKWYGLGLHLSTIQRDSLVPFSWHR